jgi:hypothetical protein
MPIQQISMRDVIVEMDESGSPGFPAMMKGCPEMRAAGFYLRNVRDFDLNSVKAIGVKGAEFDYDSSVGVN